MDKLEAQKTPCGSPRLGHEISSEFKRRVYTSIPCAQQGVAALVTELDKCIRKCLCALRKCTLVQFGFPLGEHETEDGRMWISTGGTLTQSSRKGHQKASWELNTVCCSLGTASRTEDLLSQPFPEQGLEFTLDFFPTGQRTWV